MPPQLERDQPATPVSPAPDHRNRAVAGSRPDECLVAARAADAKSGEDTVILAMGDLLGVTDAFVVTSGRNRARCGPSSTRWSAR